VDTEVDKPRQEVEILANHGKLKALTSINVDQTEIEVSD